MWLHYGIGRSCHLLTAMAVARTGGAKMWRRRRKQAVQHASGTESYNNRISPGPTILSELMEGSLLSKIEKISGVVPAEGEVPVFGEGDTVVIATRQPIGHYRMPTYLRGKAGQIEAVIPGMAVDNEEEGFGRNAGSKGHYYRVAIPMTEIWPDYVGSANDGLRIEIFETWLEKSSNV
jgi:nitrile hydratase